jgi:hypothetical protein
MAMLMIKLDLIGSAIMYELLFQALSDRFFGNIAIKKVVPVVIGLTIPFFVLKYARNFI